jgi:hypothetical protein
VEVLNTVVLSRYVCGVYAVVLHIVNCELRQEHTLKVAVADCYNLTNFVGEFLLVWTAESSDVACCGLQGCCVVLCCVVLCCVPACCELL